MPGRRYRYLQREQQHQPVAPVSACFYNPWSTLRHLVCHWCSYSYLHMDLVSLLLYNSFIHLFRLFVLLSSVFVSLFLSLFLLISHSHSFIVLDSPPLSFMLSSIALLLR